MNNKHSVDTPQIIQYKISLLNFFRKCFVCHIFIMKDENVPGVYLNIKIAANKQIELKKLIFYNDKIFTLLSL